MSEHWGYYSKTKNESSEHWFNHGEKDLIELYEHREVLAKITSLLIHVDINIGHQGSDPLDWLIEHSGEEIWLENEYGDRKPITSKTQV